MRHQPGNEHGPRDATLLTAGTVGVTFGVLSVVNHGIFEILQGDGPTGGPVIAAIGPEQRFWPLGTEDAFTLLPTFLLSGVASVIVGALIVLWSLRYLDTPAGATVFLGLFVAGFLVGGGMGHVAFFLPAWAFLATRRRHSRWLAGVLPVRARALMGHLWMPTLVLATLMTVLGVWIAVTGAVPWAAAPEAVQNLAMLAILGAAVLFVVAFVVAPAHTAAEPAAPTPSSARPATSGGRRPMDQPPVMPPAVIEVRDVHKSYERVEAVRGVSFDVRRGEVFGLLGPNGAGKTTLLAVLEGQQPADSGTATVLGLDVATRSREIAGRIGVQLQRTSLLPELSVAQQLSLFAALYGVGLTAPDRGALLEHVGLADSANALPDELSGGQRQRVALALALVNRPDILFLDEPTTGLDPHARRRLWETIRSLAAAQRTVLLTTHYMDEAEALCDRVGLIDEGRLVALDTPGALINRYAQAATVTTTARLPEDALRRESGVTSVRATNGTTRITTTDVPRTVQAVLAAAGGRQLDDLYVDQPDLEDVFIRLTGRTMHEGEPR